MNMVCCNGMFCPLRDICRRYLYGRMYVERNELGVEWVIASYNEETKHCKNFISDKHINSL